MQMQGLTKKSSILGELLAKVWGSNQTKW